MNSLRIDNQANITDQILSLSKVLMAVPSIKGNIKNLDFALEIVNQELEEFKSKQFTKNGITSMLYFANADSFKTPFKIVLSANLDVAPGTKEQFQPIKKDNKLYGRGAILKSTAAALIMAFKTAAKQIKYPIAIQIFTDLQVAGGEGIKLQLEQGITTEFNISFASTNFMISNESKGTLWIKVKNKGEKASGAKPWLGTSATWEMKHFLDRLEQSYPLISDDIWATTINLSELSSTNFLINSLPEECAAIFDIRYIPEENGSIIERIKKLMNESFEMEVIAHVKPGFTSPDNEYVAALRKSYEHVTHTPAKLVKNNFATAAQYFNSIGIPGVCFGVSGEGTYTTNEWADIKSVHDYYEVLKEFLLQLQ